MLPLAVGGLVVLGLALAGRPRAGRLLIAVGVAAIAISVAVDAPKGLDEGEAAIAYEGAEARLLEGFWIQIAAGAVLIACGLLLPRYLRRDPRHRTPGAAGKPGGARRLARGPARSSSAVRSPSPQLGQAAVEGKRGARVRAHDRGQPPHPPAAACLPGVGDLPLRLRADDDLRVHPAGRRGARRAQGGADRHGNALAVIAVFAIGALALAVFTASKPAATAVARGRRGGAAGLPARRPARRQRGRAPSTTPRQSFFDAEAVPQGGFWLEMVGALALAVTGIALATLTPEQLAAPAPAAQRERRRAEPRPSPTASKPDPARGRGEQGAQASSRPPPPHHAAPAPASAASDGYQR